MDSDTDSMETKLEFEEVDIKQESEEDQPKSLFDKRSLIREIMLNEQTRLKLTDITSKKLSQLNKNVVSQNRKNLIEELLKESKRTIGCQEMDMLNIPSTSATTDHAVNAQVSLSSIRRDTLVKSKVPFTSIRKNKLSKFLKSQVYFQHTEHHVITPEG